MLKGDVLKRTQTRQQIPYFIAQWRSFQLFRYARFFGMRAHWARMSVPQRSTCKNNFSAYGKRKIRLAVGPKYSGDVRRGLAPNPQRVSKRIQHSRLLTSSAILFRSFD